MPIDLKQITKDIFEENERRSPDGLTSDRYVQNHFVSSYKSRFFLELLQNARDAIVMGGVKKGKIKAWLEGDTLFFANNGMDFTKAGVRSICFPAISTKTDRGMIGHKGIGFNSILEITDEPAIMTNSGTFYFSTGETAGLIGQPVDILPLFQFPLYSAATVEQVYPELFIQGYTTIIKLKLDKKINGQEALIQALQITGQDIIFLSAIASMEIGEDKKEIVALTPRIILEENAKSSYYKPYEHHFSLSPEIVGTFDEDEQTQFKTDSKVECKFLLQTDISGKFMPGTQSKLYLFYALDPITGFSFSIHSFFSATIDRKGLSGQSKLNAALFSQIADYYTGDFLVAVKTDFPDDVLPILAYRRELNNNLEPFYNALKSRWTDKEFIYHPAAKRFLAPAEVLLITKKESDLFDDGVLGDKFLLYMADSRTQDWLIKECGVTQLGKDFIIRNIEGKCESRIDDPKFFERLYEQNTVWLYDLSANKILLTQNGRLVAGNETVIYYQRKLEFYTPAVLDDRLSFLHQGIRVEGLRDNHRSQLGLNEYSEESLMSAAISLFKEMTDLKNEEQQRIAVALIVFLKGLGISKIESIARMSDDLWFPVINKSTKLKDWKNLLQSPVYFENFELHEAYADDYYFIDLKTLIPEDDVSGWDSFLTSLGVWKVPAVYIQKGRKAIAGNDTRFINNDREFHQPQSEITVAYSRSIISSWPVYHGFIASTLIGDMTLRIDGERYTDEKTKIAQSGTVNYFKNHSWVPVLYKDKVSLKQPHQVVAMSQSDYVKVHNQPILEYLPVILLDQFTDNQFLTDFDIFHFSVNSLESYRKLFRMVLEIYPEPEQNPDKNGFEKFFNRLLTYLHDCLNVLGAHETDVRLFEQEQFLTKSLIDQTFQWTKGINAIHIDQKAFLDKVTDAGLIEKVTNPFVFTKRDRNEWGKYAAKIGRSISKIIKTKIASSGEPSGLSECVKNPEVMLAFVEDDQDKNFSDEELESFRNKNLIIHKAMKLEVDIEGDKYNLEQPFFVEGEKKKSILHIDEGLLIYATKDFSRALAEYFEYLTDLDMKRLDLIINDIQLLNSKEQKYEYAVSRDIDHSRLEEIGHLFEQGITIAMPADAAAVLVDKIKIGAGPAITVTTKLVQEQVEVKEITISNGFANYLEVLDNAVNTPVLPFTVAADIQPSSATGPPKPSPAINYTPRTELSDQSKKDLGFLAEYFVFRKLTIKQPALYEQLRLEPEQEIDLNWFNLPRLKNPELADGSIGKGCDMEIRDAGRFIEVKGMAGLSDLFTITNNEFKKMKEAGDNYYLIVVKNVYQEQRIVTIVVRNPYREIVLGNLRFIKGEMTAPY